MLLPFQKKAYAAGAQEPHVPHPDSREFIPYFCHWDADTLLTKNGELMQIIHIPSTAGGLEFESGAAGHGNVRDILRQVIASSIDSDKFALWIHTVRKRRRVHYNVQFKESFAAYAHERWKNQKRWKYQYYNEIYVSILHEGQPAKLFDAKTLKHSLLPKPTRGYHNAYLEKTCGSLQRTVAAMVEKLKTAYAPKLLSLTERDGVVHSEPMEFLGTLVNLRQDIYPLIEADISETLASTVLTFGFNALETRKAGKRRFAALLTIKQYREMPVETADGVLQGPMEFVISQAFHFIPNKQALKPYKEQRRFFEMSGDEHSIIASGIDDMMASDKGTKVDFGEHQISIMVLADDYKQLDSELIKIQEGFNEFGLIAIREDIKLEECFWAQLPGNFEFLRRKSTLNTARIGGFCRLNRFAAGQEQGNHWGEAVSLVPTIVNSPYFFNFHLGDNGHTVLFDFDTFGDHNGDILLNFLLTEARKYNARLCIFDRNQSARLLMGKLGGAYHGFPTLVDEYDPFPALPPIKLNPFALDDTPRNRGFLLAWCASLMAPALAPTDAQKETLRAAIATLYEHAPEQRNLMALSQHLAASDPMLAKALAAWHGEGKYAGLIDSASDAFNPAALLYAFDMMPVAAHPQTVIPVFSYLLHRLILALDDKPTIIVLHEAWDLLENAFFAPRLESLLEMLRQHNAMVIFTTAQPQAHQAARVLGAIMQNCATKIYIPADIALDYAMPELGVGESDAHMLRRMERQKGDFLVKQGDNVTGLRVDLSHAGDLHAIYANDSKNLALFKDSKGG